MTRFTHFATGCSAFALAGFVTVGAQTPQPSPSTTQQSSRQEVTAVGCLKADSSMGSMGSQSGSATGGQTGAASATAAGGRYKLEDAKITASGSSSGSMSGQSATGSTATGSSATGTTSGTERDKDKKDMDIALMPATSSVNLSEHLNHQVEVRGSWDMAASSMGSTGSTTGTTGSTATGSTATGSTGSTGSSTMGSSSDRPHGGKSLKVTSVRMVSSTCS